MTNDTKNALSALAEALESECARGHIADERGDVHQACVKLKLALSNEPTEPGAAWVCGPQPQATTFKLPINHGPVTG